jgi:hypothetical protein
LLFLTCVYSDVLQSLHREEKEADWLGRQQQERGDRERPLPREERVQDIRKYYTPWVR